MHGSSDDVCPPQIIWCMVPEIWSMMDRRQNFFVILDHFLHFNNLKSQNFEKLKKTFGEIIILHKCSKNYYHMQYCSLDMAHNGFNCYFSFGAIFCPFTFLTAQKIKILKTWKKWSCYNKCTKNHEHMLYWSWDMVHDRCNYFSFWAIFCPFTPLTAQKIKILG